MPTMSARERRASRAGAARGHRPGPGSAVRSAGEGATARQSGGVRSRPVRALAVLLVSGFALTVLAACGGGSNVGEGALVGPAEFAAAVARPGTVTVNVHVPDEGSIRGTDLWIPYDQIETRADSLPARSRPLAVYCRSGSMSALAVAKLRALGYESVTELDGGMIAWEASGRPLLPPRRT